MQRPLISLKDFGGLESEGDTKDTHPLRAIDLLNGYNKKGQWHPRKGWRKIDCSPQPVIASANGLGIACFRGMYSAASHYEWIIACCGEHIYKYETKVENSKMGLKNGTSIKAGRDPNAQVQFVQYEDYLVVLNNAEDNGKIRDTNAPTFEKLGITKPSSDPNAAEGGAGNCKAGTHKIKVLYLNGNTGHPSNPCGDNAEVTIADNKQINLTNVPTSTDSQTTKREIYMTTASGEVYYLALTIANNVDTTGTIDIADTTLIEQDELEYDNDVVARCKFGCVHQGRLFLSGYYNEPDTIYYSKVGCCESFPTNNKIVIRGQKGQMGRIRTTGLFEYRNQLIIAFEDTFAMLVGDVTSVNDFAIVDLKTEFGCSSPFSIQITDRGVIFASGQKETFKLCLFNNSQTTDISSNLIGDKLADYDIKGMGWGYAGKQYKFPVSVLHPQKSFYILAINKDNSSANKNLWIVYDYQFGQFYFWDRNAIDFCTPSGRWDDLVSMNSSGMLALEDLESSDGASHSTTKSGTATSGGNTYLEDTGATFETTPDLEDAPVYIYEGTGRGQRRMVSSNTGIRLTITPNWTTNPDGTSKYIVGAIKHFRISKPFDCGSSSDYKVFWKLYAHNKTAQNKTLEFLFFEKEGRSKVLFTNNSTTVESADGRTQGWTDGIAGDYILAKDEWELYEIASISDNHTMVLERKYYEPDGSATKTAGYYVGKRITIDLDDDYTYKDIMRKLRTIGIAFGIYDMDFDEFAMKQIEVSYEAKGKN